MSNSPAVNTFLTEQLQTRPRKQSYNLLIRRHHLNFALGMNTEPLEGRIPVFTDQEIAQRFYNYIYWA